MPATFDTSVRAKLAVSDVEAGAMLGVGRTKLRELLQAGAIAYVKIGRRTLVPVSAIESYLRELLAAQGQ